MAYAATRPEAAPSAPSALYRAIWRWHFYAGLFVLPFLLVLATTGLIMIYGNSVETFLGKKYFVEPGGAHIDVVKQALAAQAAVPGGTVTMYVAPPSADRSSVFVITADGKEHVVSVDPHDGRVLGSIVKDDTLFYWARNIHGTLLLGKPGSWIIEVAAGLGVIMVLTGLYMWWPRDGGAAQVFIPNLAVRGRRLWKELHVSTGFYIAVFLLFFLISGLSWTPFWGAKMTQAWSTFPAAKWDDVPLSDKTHASMNHGALREVPWALEETPMPASGSTAGIAGVPEGQPVNLDSVVLLARGIGFDQQFRINLPVGDDGVYTVSADSMDDDTNDPMGDRTVHIDQYTGKILADVRFADYSLPGKAMAIGIALHQANLGLWNTALNTAYCLSVIFLVVSGVVMWWKRRPAGSFAVPRYPRGYRLPAGILGIAVAVSVMFPLTGIAIAFFTVIDFLLPKRWKEGGPAALTQAG